MNSRNLWFLRYAQKAKQLSVLVRDVPETPLDKAVYWTEYVLRHKGALHLRSGARDLNFFQYYVLDVTAAILALVALVLYLVVKSCKLMCKCAFGKKTKKVHFKRE